MPIAVRRADHGATVQRRPLHHRTVHRCDAPLDFASTAFNFAAGHEALTRVNVETYLKRSGVDPSAEHEPTILPWRCLVASTRGVALLPAYAQNFLPWSAISRPIKGEAPTVNLVIGYSNANTSPILKTFLSKSDDLISRVAKKMNTTANVSC